MAISSTALKLASVLIVSLVLTATPPHVESAITCNGVFTSISSCFNYVKGGGSIPPACCDGVKSLNAKTQANPDLQEACRCIKSLVPSLGANPNLVNGLPKKCGVNLPFKYSPDLDCSKIHR